MESYKLVNSKEVQEKAFRLGYGWFSGDDKHIRELESTFLYLYDDTWDIKNGSLPLYYSEHEGTEITQSDFLALPEPLKKNDWVLIYKKTHHELWLYDGEMELIEGQYIKLSNEQAKTLNMEIYN